MLYWADYTRGTASGDYSSYGSTFLRLFSTYSTDNIIGTGGALAFSLENDIDQGGIGDCYFLSGLSGIGEQNPTTLINAFQTNTTNSGGIFAA